MAETEIVGQLPQTGSPSIEDQSAYSGVRLPTAWRDFTDILERNAAAQAGIETGLLNPPRLYEQGLTLLTQMMDRADQVHLSAQREQAITAGVSSDQADAVYWHGLESVSAYTALQGAQVDPDVQARYKHGLIGDESTHPEGNYGVIKETVAVLRRLGPGIVHFPTINEVLLREQNRFWHTYQKRKEFQEFGLGPTSPEFMLLMLVELELGAKRHMVNPVYRAMNNYAQKNPVVLNASTKEDVVGLKAERLKRLLAGSNTGLSPTNNQKQREVRLQQIYGTEFFRGYYTRLRKTTTELAAKTYGPDAEIALFVIRSIAFMKTSKADEDQGVAELRARIIEPLSRGEVFEARAAVRGLILEFPDLYDEFVWNELGVTQQEIDEFKKAAVEDRHRQAVKQQTQKFEQQELRRKEQEAVYSARARQQAEADRDPKLLPAVEGFFGKSLLMLIRGGFGEVFDRRIKVKGPGKPGFIEVTIENDTDRSTNRSIPIRRGVRYTYGGFIRALAEHSAEEIKEEKL